MKNNPTQLELFDLHHQETEGNSAKADPLQLAKVRGYQKAIFQVIAFIFVGLLSFSLGVEKGKKLIVRVTPQEIKAPFVPLSEAIGGAAVSDKPQKPGRGALQEAQPSPRQSPSAFTPKSAPIAKEESPQARYTIQVASILRSENVKKELSHLKDKGYNVFVLIKGKYTVICVGKFAVQGQAQNSLAKLKNKYPDCQIRKL